MIAAGILKSALADVPDDADLYIEDGDYGTSCAIIIPCADGTAERVIEVGYGFESIASPSIASRSRIWSRPSPAEVLSGHGLVLAQSDDSGVTLDSARP